MRSWRVCPIGKEVPIFRPIQSRSLASQVISLQWLRWYQKRDRIEYRPSILRKSSRKSQRQIEMQRNDSDDDNLGTMKQVQNNDVSSRQAKDLLSSHWWTTMGCHWCLPWCCWVRILDAALMGDGKQLDLLMCDDTVSRQVFRFCPYSQRQPGNHPTMF